MSRKPRIVVPEIPHHVVQRGNRKQQTFFADGDYRLYLSLLKRRCEDQSVALWAYCLMPNHVHLILVPAEAGSMARVVGETHKAYARRINKRNDWTGHLWQSRFASFAMDERHFLMAARYIELNPVRAGIVSDPVSYSWSSAAAHVGRRFEILSPDDPSLHLVRDWRRFLADGLGTAVWDEQRQHLHSGLPMGSSEFLLDAERKTGISTRKSKRGRPPKQ